VNGENAVRFTLPVEKEGKFTEKMLDGDPLYIVS
jgi:hypothetical protein